MRKWIIPLAVMMMVPALGAATPIVIANPTPENLVEGHTVFTVLEQVNAQIIDEREYAAAVAVLVREVTQVRERFVFPGVLWFNDQYLVNPVDEDNNDRDFRFPCTGAVLATNSGAGDPRTAFAAATPVYVESYTITDPNDRSWTIDKWQDASVGFIWTVPILNNELTRSVPDDDTNCAPVHETELPSSIAAVPCLTGGTGNQGGVPYAPGATGLSPGRCEDASYTTTNGNAITYNAVLYFRLVDLTVDAGVKDHNVASADVSGCHEPVDPAFATGGGGNWPCPAADDDAEGNSHPYNPFGSGLCPICAGAGNHGGSDLTQTQGLHQMKSISIYYDAAPTPLVRDFYLVDVVGSAAPFHDHA